MNNLYHQNLYSLTAKIGSNLSTQRLMFLKMVIISVRLHSLKISQETPLSDVKKTATLQFCQKMISLELWELLRKENTMKRFNSYRVFHISIKSPKTLWVKLAFNSRICLPSKVRLYIKRATRQIMCILLKKGSMK